MQPLLRILFYAAQPFIGHPERAQMMAAGFALLLVAAFVQSGRFRPVTHLGILLTAGLWIAFSVNERQYVEMRNPIRVDLLFAWPPLLVISLAAAGLGLRQIVAGEPEDLDADHPPDDSALRAGHSG